MQRFLVWLPFLFPFVACAHGPISADQINNKRSIVEFRLVYETYAHDRIEASLPGDLGKRFLGPIELSITDVALARFVFLPNLGNTGPIPTIELVMTPQGAAKFATLTRTHIKQRLAILVRGSVLTAPVIFEEISGGTAHITGRFSDDEARKIAEDIAVVLESSNQAL